MEQFLRESGFTIEKGNSLHRNRNTGTLPDYIGILEYKRNSIRVRCYGNEGYKGCLAKIVIKFAYGSVWKVKVAYGDLP